MKFTVKEFRAQLALAKSLPAEARKTFLDNLKSADVYEVSEVDGKSVETKVLVDIEDTTSAADAVQKTVAVDEAAIKRLTDAAVADAITKLQKDLPAPKRLAKPEEVKEYRIPAEVKRYVAIKHFASVKRHGMEQDERAYAFGMWSMACMGNEGAKSWCNEHGIEVKVQSENINSFGGFSVPEVLSSDLIDLKETYGTCRRLFNRYAMTSDTLMINRRSSGLTAAFTAENAAIAESTMSLDQVRLVAKDLASIARMSGQLNADSIINWSDRLAYEIGYAFSLKEDQCGWIGDGTSTYGGISGITKQLLANWVAGVPGTGVGVIKQATSNTWATIAIGDFDAVVGALPQYADSPNCVWAMHRTFYYTVVEKLIQAQGGVPAYETRQGQRAPRPLFKGYPVEFVQVLPSTSSSGSILATLGDHSLAAAFGDRQQDSISFSDQAYVNGQSMWERNQMGVRGIERFDINCHDVGNGTTVGPVVGFAQG